MNLVVPCQPPDPISIHQLWPWAWFWLWGRCRIPLQFYSWQPEGTTSVLILGLSVQHLRACLSQGMILTAVVWSREEGVWGRRNPEPWELWKSVFTIRKPKLMWSMLFLEDAERDQVCESHAGSLGLALHQPSYQILLSFFLLFPYSLPMYHPYPFFPFLSLSLLKREPKLPSILQSSCLSLPSAGITGVYYHSCLNFPIFCFYIPID
jgi:hypothetical protein